MSPTLSCSVGTSRGLFSNFFLSISHTSLRSNRLEDPPELSLTLLSLRVLMSFVGCSMLPHLRSSDKLLALLPL